ncbi:uncharacterized protein Bfra_003323 [Botrytis fragariae]|uniref:F-box domain-containing protein n=1 Tax=Botrytis fragariae TaxID=1964551 RepID=A0A8H6EJV4_9HELO|nr:uncharacterized protein Bfra_003323 [Botrytis fragariae]KAF5874874.1 hypothetical protein Bfra_003323 [Botrytis fragariae]
MSNLSFKLNLVLLVPELLTAIISYLPNPDLKSLRLTCKALGEEVPLHFDRVFLSANPRNIEVARAIADNENFRKGVQEIIWDDALLVHEIVRPNEAIHLLAESPRAEDDPPTWFIRACKDNIENLKNLKRDRKRPKTREFLPFSESWSYYETLLEQQEEVLISGADVNALTYVLERFQSLRRITITPAAHGSLDRPLYETPMIKSFPKGFNYPIPRGWPSSGPFGLYILPPWNDETAKKQWRGFCVITNVLAGRNDHHISELIMDVRELSTGLSCRVFDEPCEEYDNLVHLIRQPGFRRIDLALLADGQYYDDDWSSFRSGHLKRMFEAAPDLDHVSLRITADYGQIYPDFEQNRIPLQTIFPVDRWQKLQYFGLSNFIVDGPDLLSLLGALPITLRFVELSFLEIVGDRGNYRDILLDIRDTLDWRDRAANARPKLIIHVHGSSMRYTPMRYQCVDDQANGFIYGDKENPFGARSNGNALIHKMGIERSNFGCCSPE